MWQLLKRKIYRLNTRKLADPPSRAESRANYVPVPHTIKSDHAKYPVRI